LGIIDDDYHGAGNYKGIPVIGKEENLIDFKDFQFLCATNWTPDPFSARNRQKRARQLEMLANYKLATLVSPQAVVSKFSAIEPGTIIYQFAIVEPEVTIGKHSVLYDHSFVGHESSVGNNVVLQRHCFVTSLVAVEDNVYMGLCSRACRSHTTISNGTFLHPTLTLLRSTSPGETVSLAGRKVYPELYIE
jgi:acetyltransferase EpsM